MDSADELTSAWRATQDRLPSGWTLDGIRCTSTGLAPQDRGEGWRALALGPDGQSIEVEGDDAEAALRELARTIEGLTSAE
ncbi:MAG TPA: hypothetical protein VHR55_07975 [Candidatus Limnocylindria bacterium]|nr:hypothetical protein [Candidatus Limnocylindria bacterium]